MLTGWQDIGGKRYYFQMGEGLGERGKLYTGWRTLGVIPIISRWAEIREQKARCTRAGG